MRFVVLGDLHYSYYADASISQGRELFYDNLLTELAELQPDLIFSIGDAVNEGRVQEYEGLWSLIKKRGLRNRFLIVTGNHDVLKNSKQAVRFFLQPPAQLFSDYATPDESYYAFDAGPARFLVLDSAKEMQEEDWGGLIEKAQLDWLQNEVAVFNQQQSKQLLVVLAHHPLLHTTVRSEREMMNIGNSDEVWAVLNSLEHGRGLYFNGHNHVNSIATRGNWSFVQTGALYRCVDYRVCDVTPTIENGLKVEISSRNVNLGSESTFALANQLGDALDHFSSPAQPKGLEADRFLSLQL